MISLENLFKEILPIYSRYMTMDISKLPVDVLSKIVAYKLGEPRYMRLKHNEALKKIQRKYMIEYLGPKRKRRRRKTTVEFAIMRQGVSFPKESVSRIITNQENQLLDIIYNEIDTDDEDEELPSTFLSVNAKAFARISGKEYENNIFDCCDFSTPLIITDGNHLWHNLIEIAEDIEDQIRLEHERFNFDAFGISIFDFKLVFK